LDQRRYEQGDTAVVVVNAQRDISVKCGYRQRDTTDPRRWSVVQDVVDISANVQVFLEERNGALGGLVAAQRPTLER
jgi:hypothetical protein